MMESAATETEPIPVREESDTPTEHLIDTICRHFVVSRDDLRRPGRQSTSITRARYSAMFLLREEIGLNARQIGELLDRNGPNVTQTLSNQTARFAEPEFRAQLDSISATFHAERLGGTNDFRADLVARQTEEMFAAREAERKQPPVPPDSDPVPPEAETDRTAAVIERVITAAADEFQVTAGAVRRGHKADRASEARGAAAMILNQQYEIDWAVIGKAVERTPAQVTNLISNFRASLKRSSEQREAMERLIKRVADEEVPTAAPAVMVERTIALEAEYEPDPAETERIYRIRAVVARFYGIEDHEMDDFSRNQRYSPVSLARSMAFRIAKSQSKVPDEAIAYDFARTKTQIRASDTQFVKRIQKSPELQEHLQLLTAHLEDGTELKTKSQLEAAKVATQPIKADTAKKRVTYDKLVERDVPPEERAFFQAVARHDARAKRKFQERYGLIAEQVVAGRFPEVPTEVALPIAQEAVEVAGRTFIPEMHPGFREWAEKVVANRITGHLAEVEHTERVGKIDPEQYLEQCHRHWERAMALKKGMKPLETKQAISVVNNLANARFTELADAAGARPEVKYRQHLRQLLVDRMENIAQLPWLLGRARTRDKSIPELEPFDKLLEPQQTRVLELTMERLVKESGEFGD